MLERLKFILRKRQARQFIDGVTAWYHACSQVTDLVGTALRDEPMATQDIGVILDKTDRLLFGLRETTDDASRAVRRYDATLAYRLRQTSNGIYALRNEMARFLIRAQGPGFPSAGQMSSHDLATHHSRAMMEVGVHARQMKSEIDTELTSLWSDLQRWMVRADELLKTD